MIRWLMRHKFLFDNGSGMTSQLVGVFNTSMLIVATGDRLWKGHTRALIILAGLAYLCGTWALGWAMDRYDLIRAYNDEIFKRNERLMKVADLAEDKTR